MKPTHPLPNPIRPMHRSMLGSQGWTRAPAGMSRIGLDDETKDRLTIVALSVFTDCVNGGKTFQDAILAVYMTGLENGCMASKENEDASRNQ